MAKQKRDAKATQTKILQEARALFSKQGYDATTIDDIAKRSGVNKALIYYYFKHKSGLYSEIMSGLFDAVYKEVLQAKNSCTTVIEELEVFIKSYAYYAQKNPYFPALVLRELSDSGAHLSEMTFSSMRKLFLLLSDILQRGFSQKVFNKSIPIVIHFMIIGTLNLMVTTESLRKKAILIDENIDTCSECTSDEIANYIFYSIETSLLSKKA